MLELDLNPVIVTATGVHVVDVRVRVGHHRYEGDDGSGVRGHAHADKGVLVRVRRVAG